MSVVIIGGNECMSRKYTDICQEHGCKAKVFPTGKQANFCLAFLFFCNFFAVFLWKRRFFPIPEKIA